MRWARLCTARYPFSMRNRTRLVGQTARHPTGTDPSLEVAALADVDPSQPSTAVEHILDAIAGDPNAATD
ncbi:hypothetical protein HYQ46_002999 [Verticillium longisporum]|nr:hypothetical protein HYQ46_002999 [Verticillium longisporum]